jgi:hypothetical protein
MPDEDWARQIEAIKEGNDVVHVVVERHRAVRAFALSVPAEIEAKHPMACREEREHGIPVLGIAPGAVDQDERRFVAALVVVGKSPPGP